MRSRSIGLLAVVALTSVAAAPLVRANMWMGTIAGKDGSAITGSGQMNAGTDAATTVVDVTLKGDAANSVRPWHIHIGSCTRPGGVFGGGRSYTPITIDASGNGSSKATLPVALPDTGSYYVNIHDSSANMAKIVACGDLSFHKM